MRVRSRRRLVGILTVTAQGVIHYQIREGGWRPVAGPKSFVECFVYGRRIVPSRMPETREKLNTWSRFLCELVQSFTSCSPEPFLARLC